MTTLFGVYVRHYQEANEEKRKLAERHQASINKHLTEEEKEQKFELLNHQKKYLEEIKEYRKLALDLLKKYSS